MTARTPQNVLICEPQDVDNRFPFLPYIWAVLKTYWERFGEGEHHFNWLDPIILNEPPEKALAPYEDIDVDVLGISCYTWNWKVQCEIAQHVKSRHPDCLVVAGGPEPDYKDPDFFAKHPYIDAIVVKDGEIAFNKILAKLIKGERNFSDIRGLYIPKPDGSGHFSTGPAEVPTVFDYSPYVEQRAFYDRLSAANEPGAFQAVLETNRGCPYACSFCDWGSSTMSKVRRFDMKRVEPEIEFLCEMKIRFLFETDANFGILPRDLDIADMIIAGREKTGYPWSLYYSAAKNQPERVVAVARKFATAGLMPMHVLALQHTRKEVLAATDRSNISADKQVEVVKMMKEDKIPIDVQLILGMPGDTYELWKSCFSDLMENGIHEHYHTFFYHLLPNAPAADPAFMEKWKVGTIERFIFDTPARGVGNAKEALDRKRRERLIVESSTYTREDWARMATYAALVRALHHSSVTQRVAVYLRLTHNVPYRDFYEGLIDGFFNESPVGTYIYNAIHKHYQWFLEDRDASDHMEVAELPKLPFALDPARWAYLQICMRLDEFFGALRSYLIATYPDATNLDSALEYQRDLIILPSYDKAAGKVFRTEYDWVQYFDDAKRRAGFEALEEPNMLGGPTMVEVSDQVCGERSRLHSSYMVHPIDWDSRDDDERWAQWINRTVIGRGSAGMNNFQDLQLVGPSSLARAS